MAELILVAQLAALQIAKLLLVNSDFFNSVRRTDDSNFLSPIFQFAELTIALS